MQTACPGPPCSGSGSSWPSPSSPRLPTHVFPTGSLGTPPRDTLTWKTLPTRTPRRCQPTLLHPEDPEPRLGDGGIERGADAQRQHPSGIERIDHAVVPQTGCREIGRSLALVGVQDRGLERVAILL